LVSAHAANRFHRRWCGESGDGRFGRSPAVTSKGGGAELPLAAAWAGADARCPLAGLVCRPGDNARRRASGGLRISLVRPEFSKHNWRSICSSPVSTGPLPASAFASMTITRVPHLRYTGQGSESSNPIPVQGKNLRIPPFSRGAHTPFCIPDWLRFLYPGVGGLERIGVRGEVAPPD
jgi:hypothetical protein